MKSLFQSFNMQTLRFLYNRSCAGIAGGVGVCYFKKSGKLSKADNLAQLCYFSFSIISSCQCEVILV